jgi:hypothetical protein
MKDIFFFVRMTWQFGPDRMPARRQQFVKIVKFILQRSTNWKIKSDLFAA